MSEVRISAEPRTEFGKGGARRTRRAGKVPAVIYGHGAEVKHVSLDARELMFAFRNGARPILNLDLNGQSELAVPKAVVRDPLSLEVEHVDLMVVNKAEAAAFEKELEEAAAAAAAAEAELQAKIEAEAEAAAAHEAEEEAAEAEAGDAEGETAEAGEGAEAAAEETTEA